MMCSRGAAAVVVAVGLALTSGGALLSEGGSLSDMTLGTHWFGPELSKEDLVGRVVLLEFWGIA